MAKQKSKDGGQAFPTVPINGDSAKYRGMTLRDYFAAKALPGVLLLRAMLSGENLSEFQEDIADECWQLADALIARRDVTQEDE